MQRKRFFVSVFLFICCLIMVGCVNKKYSLNIEIISNGEAFYVGDEIDFKVSVIPGDIIIDYEYESSNENIFVCENGKIKAINKGIAELKITATYDKQVLEGKETISINKYDIENINVVTGNFSLPGKLTVPDSDKKVPAVVFLHGSGPMDMDSTVNAIKLFKELSEGLARRGIASIRYDKRSFTYNKEMALNYFATVRDEYIDDGLSAIALLKSDSRIDSNNIFIIGHSLGANFAPVLLNLDDSIKGAVLLAGAPVHILDLLLEQVKRINGQGVADQYEEAIMESRFILEIKDEKHFYPYMGAYEPYVVSYNQINFIAETQNAALTKKILIMQGGMDLQVYDEHFDQWKEYLRDSENVEFKYYNNLNHLFTDGQGENASNAYGTYKPISIEAIKDISLWIMKSR